VEDLSLNKIADEKAPYKWSDVGWYQRGPRPGDEGRATIFGHLDSYCCPAVFYHLKDLKPGDQIKVAYRGNQAITFRVIWQQIYPNAKVPIDWIYGRARERGLVLMTCAGVFYRSPGGGYDHKLIVYARLVLPSGELG
jgi:sortase (surface protein transpeptidase)